MREDLVATKEALNRALLDREVLDGQKREVGEYLISCILRTEICFFKLHDTA